MINLASTLQFELQFDINNGHFTRKPRCVSTSAWDSYRPLTKVKAQILVKAPEFTLCLNFVTCYPLAAYWPVISQINYVYVLNLT
jgi:hypothetical protein